MKKANRFGRGGLTKAGGAYNCIMCGRTTRETGSGESSLALCADCLFLTEIENSLRDDGIEVLGAYVKETTEEIHRRIAKVKERGGETGCFDNLIYLLRGW